MKFLSWLLNRRPELAPSKAANPPTSPRGYRAFTTEFDREIHASEIDELLSWDGSAEFRDYAKQLDKAMLGWIASAEIAAIEAGAKYLAAGKLAPHRSTVICLLIDHSGSMKGQRAILAIAIARVLADFWHRIGVQFEILGFTTKSWHGGDSRKKWQRLGAPANPGRLCDLLHIIYRAAGDQRPGVTWAIRNIARTELLKENVDGEAVQWAQGRLMARPEQRKLLIVLTDGAPVDDSTMLASGLSILHDHLKAVVASIASEGRIELAAVGLDYDARNYYPQNITISAPDDLAMRLLPFITALMTAQAHGSNAMAEKVEPTLH